MNDFDFAGKTVVVTGGSMGIGESFARELSQRGAQPVLVARGRDKLQRLAESLGGAHVIAEDLAKPGAAKRVYDAVVAKGLEMDVRINNAGFASYGPFTEVPLGTQREQVDLNVHGAGNTFTTLLARFFTREFVAKLSGRLMRPKKQLALNAG